MSVSQVVLSLPGVSVSDSVPAHLFLSLLQSLPLSRVASTWFFLSFLRVALFSSTFPPSPSISTSVFISVSFIVLTYFSGSLQVSRACVRVCGGGGCLHLSFILSLPPPPPPILHMLQRDLTCKYLKKSAGCCWNKAEITSLTPSYLSRPNIRDPAVGCPVLDK